MARKKQETKPIETDDKKPVLSLSPIVALVSVIFIYFASQIFAVNIMAVIGAIQGKNAEQIIEWMSDGLLVQSLILSLIVAFGMFLIYALLKITKLSWKRIGLVKFQPKYVLSALIGYGWYFLIFLGITFVITALVPQVDFDQQQQLGFDRTASGSALWVIGFCLVVLPAFYEEVLMRGVLFTGLRSKLSFPVTLLVVSIVFAVAHLEWGGDNPLNWAAAIDTFALSVVLVYLRENSKSLWPAIILHGIKNLVAFSIVFVFKVAGV